MGMWDHKSVAEIFAIIRKNSALEFSRELERTKGDRDKAWAAADAWARKALAEIEFDQHPEVRRAGD